jgi:hypothetical protein
VLVGLSRPNHYEPIERTLRYLLRDVCVTWGFCLPPADVDRIAQTPNLTAEQFAEEVLLAEGFEPSQNPELVERFTMLFHAHVGLMPLTTDASDEEP